MNKLSIVLLGTVALVAVLAVGFVYTDSAEEESPDDVVPLGDGKVLNERQNIVGKTDGEVSCYKGIPYAEAPVGDLRFAPPVPKAPWTETLDCTEFRDSCCQLMIPRTDMSEDCLFLNVWAPADARPGDNLPVYVWIHGGAFLIGTGSNQVYDGTEFAKDGIVTVTINYRLGMLGYLNMQTLKDEYGSAGNFGTLDQVMALRWVHDNIRDFGGDAGNVTIGGESAGGASVFNLLMCKQAGGLFQQAIMESGTICCGFTPMIAADDAKSLYMTRMLLDTLGLKDDEAGLAALRTMDPMLMANLVSPQLNELVDKPYAFMPIFDGVVLPKEPIKALKEGDYNRDVKVIIGTNAHEGDLFDGFPLTKYEIPKYLIRNYGGADYEAIMEIYEKDRRSVSKQINEIVALTLFQVPGAIVQDALASNGETVYAYEFDYTGSKGMDPIHMSELPYAFGNLDATNNDPTDTDLRVQSQMHGMWVNFIKTGDPNGGSGLPSEVEWERYDPGVRKAFHIDGECSFAEKTVADKIDRVQPYYNLCG